MIILKIGAVIMASGLSKRMKTDKLMLKYNDKFIFEYIIDLVVKSNFYDRIVITNNSTIIEYCKKSESKRLIIQTMESDKVNQLN